MTLQQWANDVRERDNNTCRFCGSKDRPEAHHIRQKAYFPQLSTVIKNGVTLCHECHLRAHGGTYNPRSSPMHRRFTDDYCRPVKEFIESLARENERI